MRVSIGFSSSDWWVSRVIRFFTRVPAGGASHTYIVFDDAGTLFGHEVYEAAWCGFRMSTRDKLTSGSTRIVSEIEVHLAPASALQMCRRWLETPYDYAGLLGEAWVQVGKLFGKRWRNPWAGPHHMFCSEAATYLLQQTPSTSGTVNRDTIVSKLDPRTTDPYMLQQVLLGSGPGGNA
jgi:hypothetical protein